MADYVAWIVIEEADAVLLQVLRRFGNPSVDLSDRPRIWLGRANGRVTMRVADPANAFKVLQRPGDKVRAITSASQGDIWDFHGKLFGHSGARYTVECDLRKDANAAPYSRRFLTIMLSGEGTHVDEPGRIGELTATEIELCEPEQNNLWLNPQRVLLTEQQVDFEFGAQGAADQLISSFMLPPYRHDDNPNLQNSYFNQRLLDLRAGLFGLLGDLRTRRDAAAIAMVRVCDYPLLRDVLVDGGALELVGGEGKRTRFVLHVPSNAQIPASAYRARTILTHLPITAPSMAVDLSSAIRKDLETVLAGAALEPVAATQKGYWAWDRFSELPHEGNFEEGSWTHIKKLEESLEPDDRNSLWELVLMPSVPPPGANANDHDYAERLFVHHAWRCPWAYPAGPNLDAWREAFREILIADFELPARTPETRVDGWNRSEGSNNFCYERRASAPSPAAAIEREIEPFGDGSPEEVDNTIFVLKHRGDPDRDEVIRWRLLLPWGSVVNARTLILSRSNRSKLDGSFVLA